MLSLHTMDNKHIVNYRFQVKCVYCVTMEQHTLRRQWGLHIKIAILNEKFHKLRTLIVKSLYIETILFSEQHDILINRIFGNSQLLQIVKKKKNIQWVNLELSIFVI